jgi:hypothetical protein
MRAEVRGRGREWRVFYTNEASLGSPFPVYDRDGLLKDVILAGAPPTKEALVEAYGLCRSVQEAEEYARYLGATEVVVRRTMTREEALALARAAKKETA